MCDLIHQPINSQMRSLNNNSFIQHNLTIGPGGYECYDAIGPRSGVAQAMGHRAGAKDRCKSPPSRSDSKSAKLGTSVRATPRPDGAEQWQLKAEPAVERRRRPARSGEPVHVVRPARSGERVHEARSGEPVHVVAGKARPPSTSRLLQRVRTASRRSAAWVHGW